MFYFNFMVGLVILETGSLGWLGPLAGVNHEEEKMLPPIPHFQFYLIIWGGTMKIVRYFSNPSAQTV